MKCSDVLLIPCHFLVAPETFGYDGFFCGIVGQAVEFQYGLIILQVCPVQRDGHKVRIVQIGQ